MMHTTYSCDYWYFEGALNNEQCNKLLNIKNTKKLEKATVDDGKLPSESVRKTDVLFSSEDYLYETVTPYLELANKNAGWNFDIDWCEPAQFTEYRDGGHYQWHTDAMPIELQSKTISHKPGRIRKLSTTVVLSDGKDYEGADFQLINSKSVTPNNSSSDWEVITEPGFRTKGTIIFFPSSVWHRVTPITSGVRNSIVFWWLGYPFK